jgi:hypothetical protein
MFQIFGFENEINAWNAWILGKNGIVVQSELFDVHILEISVEQIPKRRHPLMAKQIRQAHETWKHLSQENDFQQFMKEFLAYLQDNLQKIKVHDNKGGYEYYSCGQQPHDAGNRLWRPFEHMQAFCRKKRFDFETVKGMIEDRIYKRLNCECEILTDPNDIRRKDLQRMYGMDFGMPGRRELDIV